MAKRKGKNKDKTATKMTEAKSSRGENYTLSQLKDDHELWYKMRVLIYDLRHMTKDKACERRTLETTDPLYISGPYFSADEAAVVKNTIVEADLGTTLEQALSKSLENFFEKRRASSDCRPCGPHDMVPVYLSCLSIEKAEIEEEKFVSRLRRSGLGTS